MSIAVAPAPCPHEYRNRPPVKSLCSICFKRGHTRKNRDFHPDAEPIGKRRGRRYMARYQREARVNASMHGLCVDCGDPAAVNRFDGPKARCAPCQNHMNARDKALRALRRSAIELLKRIADGICNDPVGEAAALLLTAKKET